MDSWTPAQIDDQAANPEGPRAYVEFAPSAKNGWKFSPSSKGGFEDWPSYDDLFLKYFQGVNMNRGLEDSIVDINRPALEARMKDYFSSTSFDELKGRHPGLCEPRAGYDPQATRQTQQ